MGSLPVDLTVQLDEIQLQRWTTPLREFVVLKAEAIRVAEVLQSNLEMMHQVLAREPKNAHQCRSREAITAVLGTSIRAGLKAGEWMPDEPLDLKAGLHEWKAEPQTPLEMPEAARLLAAGEKVAVGEEATEGNRCLSLATICSINNEPSHFSSKCDGFSLLSFPNSPLRVENRMTHRRAVHHTFRTSATISIDPRRDLIPNIT